MNFNVSPVLMAGTLYFFFLRSLMTFFSLLVLLLPSLKTCQPAQVLLLDVS